MVNGKDFMENVRDMKEPTIYQIDRLNRYIAEMNKEMNKPVEKRNLNWFYAQEMAYMSVIENMRNHQVFIPELHLRYYKKLEAV